MTERMPFRRIDIAEARGLLKRPDLALFDVRERAVFEEERIDGARHLSVAGLERAITGTGRGRPVLIYCYHGFASQEYATIFSDFGFTEVYSLDGGFAAWQAANDPLPAWLAAEGFAGPDGLVGNRTTALMRACHKGDIAIAKRLIAGGAALNARNADGNTALWLACVGGHAAAVALLIEAGIDIDNRNDNDATALMYAASSGKAAMVELLLKAGADTTICTLDGFTALDMAASVECLALLRRPRRFTGLLAAS